jgi:hypothetical protein
MMEPSDLRKLHDPSHLWRVNLSKKRSILVERQVGSGPQVIIEVVCQDPAEMLFSQHDDVIQTFAPHGTHQPLDKRTLPRTLGRDLHFGDSHPLESVAEILTIDLVSVAQQVTGRRIVQILDVVIKKSSPGLARRLTAPGHQPRDGTLRDFDP